MMLNAGKISVLIDIILDDLSNAMNTPLDAELHTLLNKLQELLMEIEKWSTATQRYQPMTNAPQDIILAITYDSHGRLQVTPLSED